MGDGGGEEGGVGEEASSGERGKRKRRGGVVFSANPGSEALRAFYDLYFGIFLHVVKTVTRDAFRQIYCLLWHKADELIEARDVSF